MAIPGLIRPLPCGVAPPRRVCLGGASHTPTSPPESGGSPPPPPAAEADRHDWPLPCASCRPRPGATIARCLQAATAGRTGRVLREEDPPRPGRTLLPVSLGHREEGARRVTAR